MKLLRGLWAYRYFIVNAVITGFQTRFSRSVLGGFWGVLNPLAQAAIYAFVLSYVLSAKLPGVENSAGYSIYLLSGIACWSLLSDILNRSLNMFQARANVLQKVAIPRLSLPLIEIAGALLDNLILVLCVLVVTLLLGHTYTLQLCWLPVLIVLTAIIAGGFGLFLGLVNVFMRDTAQFVGIMLQLLFWGTPIVYSSAMLPEKYNLIFQLNPVYHLVSSYQNVILYGKPVVLESLLVLAVFALAGIVLAWKAYRKSYAELMDVL